MKNPPVEILPAEQSTPAPEGLAITKSVVITNKGLVRKNDRVEVIRRPEDIVLSLYNRIHELRRIYVYNANMGIEFKEMGPYEHPLGYKLDQMNHDITQLKELFGV